jgi:hypothetical protein
MRNQPLTGWSWLELTIKVAPGRVGNSGKGCMAGFYDKLPTGQELSEEAAVPLIYIGGVPRRLGMG